MRFVITAESNGDKRQPRFPEAQIAEVLRQHGLRLVNVETQMMPLIFLGWQRRGGHWTAIAVGIDKASVRAAVEGVEGEIVILPLGCTP
jgi:hypothetical protein